MEIVYDFYQYTGFANLTFGHVIMLAAGMLY